MGTESLERLNNTFTINGKRWTKICVLPKIEEIRLIRVYFLRVSSRCQLIFHKRETR